MFEWKKGKDCELYNQGFGEQYMEETYREIKIVN